MPPIRDQTILVIGGSSGIGYGVADRCLAEGAKVIIASSNLPHIQQSVSKLQQKYPDANISGQGCDLSPACVEENLEKLFESVTPLNHIVYTAGDPLSIMPIPQINLDAVHKAGHVRFAVPLLLSKFAQRHLKPSYQSSFTLTSGAGGDKPFPGWSLMAGYLSGLQGLTRNLALDLKPLRVNLVSPGIVETPLHGPSGVTDEMKAHTTLGKVGLPEEVAEAYLYFMKDTNATGSCIDTNGGSFLV
ncbi:short-chain dehydrogenase [Fusarium redolens]|uniref:Short-chain dehydrogenase n=1 Tax=Fusarium redolens TaxID=48865 RepID=A0A9P9HDN4_FUSRE|nr:short-chain dehydrogenase [Fusarium redolens]KAH7255167.1 short-chain dehydrogenase [Fusarium redolens]